MAEIHSFPTQPVSFPSRYAIVTMPDSDGFTLREGSSTEVTFFNQVESAQDAYSRLPLRAALKCRVCRIDFKPLPSPRIQDDH